MIDPVRIVPDHASCFDGIITGFRARIFADAAARLRFATDFAPTTLEN